MGNVVFPMPVFSGSAGGVRFLCCTPGFYFSESGYSWRTIEIYFGIPAAVLCPSGFGCRDPYTPPYAVGVLYLAHIQECMDRPSAPAPPAMVSDR